MKKKKILIIGKRSFVSTSLSLFLKKKHFIKKVNLSNFFLFNQKYLKNFDFIINCSVNKNYVFKKYSKKYDFDLKIINKIQSLKCRYIFLSSRKVYKPGDNLKENNKTRPICNYSKNKLITENLLKDLINKRLLVLRISNLLGIKKKTGINRKVHHTFIDFFFTNIKKNIIFKNKELYKDFISTKQFAKIIDRLVQKNSYGIYNVSLGKKVYLDKIINWLNHYNRKKYNYLELPRKFNKDSFFLNNSKLVKEIKLKINLTDLEKDCKDISKYFFKK